MCVEMSRGLISVTSPASFRPLPGHSCKATLVERRRLGRVITPVEQSRVKHGGDGKRQDGKGQPGGGGQSTDDRDRDRCRRDRQPQAAEANVTFLVRGQRRPARVETAVILVENGVRRGGNDVSSGAVAG